MIRSGELAFAAGLRRCIGEVVRIAYWKVLAAIANSPLRDGWKKLTAQPVPTPRARLRCRNGQSR